MARVPEHEIEQLKSQIALERLAAAAGVELKRHGQDLIGCTGPPTFSWRK
jgi:hypothetical protein